MPPNTSQYPSTNQSKSSKLALFVPFPPPLLLFWLEVDAPKSKSAQSLLLAGLVSTFWVWVVVDDPNPKSKGLDIESSTRYFRILGFIFSIFCLLLPHWFWVFLLFSNQNRYFDQTLHLILPDFWIYLLLHLVATALILKGYSKVECVVSISERDSNPDISSFWVL